MPNTPVAGGEAGAAGCNRQEPASQVREDLANAQEKCRRQAEQQYDPAKAQAQAQFDAARNGDTDTNDKAPNTGG